MTALLLCQDKKQRAKNKNNFLANTLQPEKSSTSLTKLYKDWAALYDFHPKLPKWLLCPLSEKYVGQRSLGGVGAVCRCSGHTK